MRPGRTPLLALAVVVALWTAVAGCGGDDEGSGDAGVLTSGGFEEALAAVSEEAGDEALALRVELDSTGGRFQLVREGEGSGFFYSNGELQPVELQIVGSPSLQSSLFPLSEIEPGAVDAIGEGVREEIGDEDAEVSSMTLQMHIDGEPGWTVNAEAGERRGLVFEAAADGSDVDLSPDRQE